jgi:hypothetical protein
LGGVVLSVAMLSPRPVSHWHDFEWACLAGIQSNLGDRGKGLVGLRQGHGFTLSARLTRRRHPSNFPAKKYRGRLVFIPTGLQPRCSGSGGSVGANGGGGLSLCLASAVRHHGWNGCRRASRAAVPARSRRRRRASSTACSSGSEARGPAGSRARQVRSCRRMAAMSPWQSPDIVGYLRRSKK